MKSTCAKIAHVGNDGKQTYNTKYYNLDMIISIGFRVNSKKAIKFRIWANKIIKDYMVQGFVLNDDRFMKGGKSDQEYFKRLLCLYFVHAELIIIFIISIGKCP